MRVITGQAHNESLVARLVRASTAVFWEPWVRFPSGTQNFSLSHARVIVEKDHLQVRNVFVIWAKRSRFDKTRCARSSRVIFQQARKVVSGKKKMAVACDRRKHLFLEVNRWLKCAKK